MPGKVERIIRKAEAAKLREHHLQPSLRLRTTREIQQFIHHNQLVSVLGGNELPSLISAVLGREWKPTRKGFTGWNEWWNTKVNDQPVAKILKDLEQDPAILSTRIFRKTKTLVAKEIWPILDPIIRHYNQLARKHEIFNNLEWKILDTIQRAPARTDQLRKQLKLEGKKHNTPFHRSLQLLESHALIIGHEDPKPERHLHANIWQSWTNRVHENTTTLSYDEALATLLEKTIDTCIIVKKEEINKWFQWETSLSEAMTKPFDSGRVTEAGDYLVASRML
ncbi:MAG TPA: hypothetical protein VFE98_05100 [Candidatus Bathyarchaeia archaeon]|nr:hypothetical protein [Candidatus Bathyarchaeia archaeon]